MRLNSKEFLRALVGRNRESRPQGRLGKPRNWTTSLNTTAVLVFSELHRFSFYNIPSGVFILFLSVRLPSFWSLLQFQPGPQGTASSICVTLAKCAVFGMPKHLMPWAWRHSWRGEAGQCEVGRAERALASFYWATLAWLCKELKLKAAFLCSLLPAGSKWKRLVF